MIYNIFTGFYISIFFWSSLDTEMCFSFPPALIKRWNSQISFLTLFIDNETVNLVLDQQMVYTNQTSLLDHLAEDQPVEYN